MNIYLFAIEKLKSLMDIIRIGDFCFLYDKETLYLWIQDEHSLNNKTDLGIKYAQVCSNIKIICPPNPLIFSYNGVEKRTGNRKELNFLINKLNNNLIQDVLKNALDVLEYKEDRMDIVPLSKLFVQIRKQMVTLSPYFIKEEKKEIIVKPTLEKTQPKNHTVKSIKGSGTKAIETKEIYPPQAYYFYDYLGESEKKYWQTHYLEGLTTHIIYKNIRKINKKRYSESFDRFIKEHTDLNIYSRKNDVAPITISPKSEEKIDPIQSLYILLTKNGYAQTEYGEWETPDGQCLHIQVEVLKDCCQ